MRGQTTSKKWRRTFDGWISGDGQWRVRGPMMGRRMFWLYHSGLRVRTGVGYDTAVHYQTAREAKQAIRELTMAHESP